MSVKKNVFRLNKVYDLINNGLFTYYETTEDHPGQLWVWGSNGNAILGDNTVIPKSSPVQIPGTRWLTPTSSYTTAFARKDDGTLWGWGKNTVTAYNYAGGMIGVGSAAVQRSSPVQIPGTQWSKISNSCIHALATKSDGTLWVWGRAYDGVLGLSDTIHRSSPTQIPGTQWVESNAKHIKSSFAIKSDGTLWAWGNNNTAAGSTGGGQLGQSDTVHRSSPVQIPGTQWINIQSGQYNAVARKTDGTLWAWGGNSYGQLSQGDRVHRSSPIQIPGTQWNEVSAGLVHVLARKTDGTLWAWGANCPGTLGQNNTNHRSSPVQIPGNLWNNIGPVGRNNSIATKTDGTLWVWGNNAAGTLGQNDTTPSSSPVQIPGTQWLDVAINSNGLAIKNLPL